jgi:hypothetical protein
VYGDNVMSRIRVFCWQKLSMKSREEVEADESPSRHSTLEAKERAEKISEIVRTELRLSSAIIAIVFNMDKWTATQILYERLNMRKCAKMVPRNHTQEQKRNLKIICPDIIELITE